MRRNLYVMFVMCKCALLTACISDGDDIPTIGSDDTEVVATYQGSIGDGPVVGATITIRDKNGVVLNSVVSDAFANYKIAVKAKGKLYPLTIEAIGGIDLVTNSPPSFELISTVLHPSDKTANINPFSTFIVRTAEAMGGLTEGNIEQATAIVLREFNFGFDAALIRDPIATKITENEIASLVKVSESLGELIRRTQTSASENGIPVSENDVISSLSADLVDGVLDGKGEAGANDEIALRAKVIAGGVVLEALSNRLRVNDVIVTAALDASIATIMPDASSMPHTAQVASTAEMIIQLETAIKIGQRIAPSTALSELMGLTEGLIGILPGAAASLLPSDAHASLNDGLGAIAMLTTEEITEFNFPITDAVNNPPVITGTAPDSVDEGGAYFFEPESNDADGDPLVYSVANKPSWAEFNIVTGTLSGTPGFDQAGQFSEISIRVTDGKEVVALEPFLIIVENVNRLPSMNGVPLTAVVAGTAYEFTPVTIDLDGDPLVFSIVHKPAWSNFNVATGKLSGLPNNSHVGLYPDIVIQVSDGGEIISLPSFSITVGLNNSAPLISGDPSGSVSEASAYNFIPGASDADGDTLIFSIVNQPDWAQFNSNSGRLSGVPGYSDSGVYHDIQIGVSDGYVAISLPPFTISVANVNRAPTISGAPAIAVEEGVSYRFAPLAADADGEVLSFSVLNQPAWALFNATTGVLSGTPDHASSGVYSNIIVRVSDGIDLTVLPSFDITVTNVNRAPTISGTPAIAVEGGALYRFIPLAADADDDELTFSIINKPAWAGFSSVTGELSGTPEGVDVGSYPNIVVSVSDGEQLVSLDSFSLVVSEYQMPVTGSATLSWVAPATRVDGSEFLLSEIGGYRIYSGFSPTSLTLLIDLNDPTATQYIVEALAEGTHYFSVSVYDAVGSESERSAVRSKTI